LNHPPAFIAVTTRDAFYFNRTLNDPGSPSATGDKTNTGYNAYTAPGHFCILHNDVV
jgi:hypothetical protein